MHLLWELNQQWSYKDMLCVRRWSDAGTAGRVRCTMYMSSTLPRAQNRAAKGFNSITIHCANLGILIIYAWKKAIVNVVFSSFQIRSGNKNHICQWGHPIEEVWRKKPRQTVVVVFWGKFAAHISSLRLCSRQMDKRRAGSKLRGIFVYYFLLYIKCFAAFSWSI